MAVESHMSGSVGANSNSSNSHYSNNRFFSSDSDQLFLLPDCVLSMDSASFREDLASIAPSFLPNKSDLKQSNSGELIHSDSNNSNNNSSSGNNNLNGRLVDDDEELKLSRASDGCRTLWLCEGGTMESEDVSSKDMNKSSITNEPSTNNEMSNEEDFASSQKHFGSSRAMSASSTSRRSHSSSTSGAKDREERLRKVKEQQEEERRRKLEELKQHTEAAQKFREQQECERRRHFEHLRHRELDKLSQAAERRRAMEAAEAEKREAALAKAKEREEKLAEKRVQHHMKQQALFAFGSSTPRTMHPVAGSSSDIPRRSTSSNNVNSCSTQQLMSQSMYVPSSRRTAAEGSNEGDAKRSTSVTHLDKSGDGEEMQPFLQARRQQQQNHHRRRTDIMPTFASSRVTGFSREASAVTSTSTSNNNSSRNMGVRMRSAAALLTTPRKARPLSLAVSGNIMSQSMYERRSSPAGGDSKNNQKTKNDQRMLRSVSTEKDMSSSTPIRKTPSKVKADSAIKRTSKSTQRLVATPELSEVNNGNKDDNMRRGVTPDLLTSSTSSSTAIKKPKSPSKSSSITSSSTDEEEESKTNMESEVNKKPITSEEEAAKARLAEKRREMKEKKEREAEAERQRQERLAQEEEERRLREEEEELAAIAEAEKLAEEARVAEEERLEKAIAEAQRKQEVEERTRQEKEERRKKMEEEDAAKKKLEAEEAARKQAELEEKLRKEEEERLIRKKRIEEIMARTRGNKDGGSGATTPTTTPFSTPKKEPPTENNNHASSVAEAIKPDLLGDLVRAENERNDSRKTELGSPVEKGFLDTQIRESTLEGGHANKSNPVSSASSEGQTSLSEFDEFSQKETDTADALVSFNQILGNSNDGNYIAADPFGSFQENHAMGVMQEQADLLL